MKPEANTNINAVFIIDNQYETIEAFIAALLIKFVSFCLILVWLIALFHFVVMLFSVLRVIFSVLLYSPFGFII